MALNYMHKKGVIHRDLKLENIMVDIEDGEIVCKLTDFGLSCLLDKNGIASGYRGTPQYMAPEILRDEQYTCKVDTWALGVLTYAAFTGNFPFNSDVSEDRDEAIKTADFDRSKLAQQGEDVVDFISCCLDKNPETRKSAEELLSHSWILQTTDDEDYPESEIISVTENLLKV